MSSWIWILTAKPEVLSTSTAPPHHALLFPWPTCRNLQMTFTNWYNLVISAINYTFKKLTAHLWLSSKDAPHTHAHKFAEWKHRPGLIGVLLNRSLDNQQLTGNTFKLILLNELYISPSKLWWNTICYIHTRATFNQNMTPHLKKISNCQTVSIRNIRRW